MFDDLVKRHRNPIYVIPMETGIYVIQLVLDPPLESIPHLMRGEGDGSSDFCEFSMFDELAKRKKRGHS
jgi:hypothetical protein